jgi:hypothetical protein
METIVLFALLAGVAFAWRLLSPPVEGRSTEIGTPGFPFDGT